MRKNFTGPAGAPSNARAESGRFVPERVPSRSGQNECNVKVVVRCRPMTTKELDAESGYRAVKIERNQITVSRNNTPSKRYSFDGVCSEYTTQLELFEHHVSDKVTDVLEGFNCTVFAYGQTGTGKTFTMEGDFGELMHASRWSDDQNGVQLPDNAGIIPRCVEKIFERLDDGDLEYSIKVSYLEIYNEELCDLLTTEGDENKTQLRIYDKKKDDSGSHNRGLAVSGLREIPVNNMRDIFSILSTAVRKIRVAETKIKVVLGLIVSSRL